MTALLKYDAACHAIAEAKTVDEVSDWIDKAAAVREYGRRIKNRQLEIDAIEIRVRAKKRRGELLLRLREQGRIRDGRKKQSDDDDRLTLEDLGVSKDESSEDQKVAQIDGNSFERLVARCRSYAEAHPEKHSFDVLKPPPESPINGARSVMGSRQEPDDSLDYFPTPPWATRALIEIVFRHLDSADMSTFNAWEPASGEGHIAEVLAEYFCDVVESDIHDYGRNQYQQDFLAADHLNRKYNPDWIITNPPFGDKTEAFVLHALDLTEVGVAMFVRMQWLESIGRYERVFRDNPPTLIAFFAERVNLCKGRWDPDGGTATAYIWLVWHKGLPPQPPFWIPPGQREALTRPDDAERFTAHPVIKRSSHLSDDGSPTDPNTGEILGEAAE